MIATKARKQDVHKHQQVLQVPQGKKTKEKTVQVGTQNRFVHSMVCFLWWQPLSRYFEDHLNVTTPGHPSLLLLQRHVEGLLDSSASLVLAGRTFLSY